MKSLKRKLALMLVVIFILTQMPLHVLADINPGVTPASSAIDITVNFPGVEGVTVRYSTNTSGTWQNAVTDANGFASFVLPEEHFPTFGVTSIQAVRGAMTYTFLLPLDKMLLIDAPLVRYVPMTTITVTGAPAALGIGISQGGWVYNQAPADTAAPTVFNVFDNGRPYSLVIGGAGYRNFTIDGIEAGSVQDIAPLFYNIEIPYGVSVTGISNGTWVDSAIWQLAYPADTITLFRNNTEATLHFVFNGITHTVDFVLDGTNPFIGHPAIPVSGVFGLFAFNNGNSENTSLANAGLIRIWTQINGANTLVTYANLEVTATLPNGDCAMEFVHVNRIWNNTGFVNVIDVRKREANPGTIAMPWHWIDLVATYNGQPVEMRLFNNYRVFGYRLYNNGPGGTLSTPHQGHADAGRIRMFTNIDGVGTRIPYDSITIAAVLPNGDCAIELGYVSYNLVPWYAPNYVNIIDATKNAPWERIYLTVTHMDQTLNLVLVNSRLFSLNVVNNGQGGTQYPNFNQSLQNAGLIRMWTRLMGTGADVPYTAMTAELPNGSCAMEFVTVHRVGGLVRSIDVNKHAPWQRIYFSMTVFGQTVDVVLVNDLYECDPCPDCGECLNCGECLDFRFDIFNNGPGGAPSRSNANIAHIIRMWTGFGPIGGGNTALPLSTAATVTAVDQDGNNAMDLVSINEPWNNQGHFNFIDVNKNAPWQTITLTIIVCGEAHEILLVNSRVFSLEIFNNGPLGSPSTPNASLAAGGTIRMWTQLNGVNAQVPVSEVALTVTAVVPSGIDVLPFINVPNVGGSGFTNRIDTNKNAPWEFIYLTVTVFGQSIEVVLHNANFIPPQPTEFTLTVTYDAAMGTATFSPANPITAGEEVTLEAIAEYGYEFVSWAWTPAVGGNPGIALADRTNPNATFYMPARDVTLVAQFRSVQAPPPETVTVSFEPGDGTGAMTNVYVPVGENFTLPANGFTAPVGYEFYGWFVAGYATPGGSMQPGDVITVSIWPNTAVTVTAVWIPAPFTVTVTYDAAMGTATFAPASPVVFGQLVTLEAVAEYGYEFVSWAWTPAVDGNPGIALADRTNPNATFYMPARDVTLVAQFRSAQAPPPVEYAVSFLPGEGSGTMADELVEQGEAFALPAHDFTAPVGYTFYGWWVSGYANPLGTLYVGDSIIVGGAVTALALWVPAQFTVTVTYEAAMGAATFAPASPVTFGQLVTLEAVAEYGYEFVSWAWTPAVGGNPGIALADRTNPNATFYMPARDVLLVAQFRSVQAPPPVEYAVSFLPGEGSGTMADALVEQGETFALPAHGFTAPVGYTFYGWWVSGYANPLGTLYVGDSIIVGGAVIALALWVPAPFTVTVTYDAAMGAATFAPANPVVFGQLVTLEAIAEYGYEFVRWVWTPVWGGNPGIADETDANATFYMPARNVTLVAQFRSVQAPPPVEYAVSFLPGEGSGTMADALVEQGEAFALPQHDFTAPVGYTFYGWWISGYANPLGTLYVGDSIIVGGPVTALALWVPQVPLSLTIVDFVLGENDEQDRVTIRLVGTWELEHPLYEYRVYVRLFCLVDGFSIIYFCVDSYGWPKGFYFYDTVFMIDALLVHGTYAEGGGALVPVAEWLRS